jgi:hypothetical protein
VACAFYFSASHLRGCTERFVTKQGEFATFVFSSFPPILPHFPSLTSHPPLTIPSLLSTARLPLPLHQPLAQDASGLSTRQPVRSPFPHSP